MILYICKENIADTERGNDMTLDEERELYRKYNTVAINKVCALCKQQGVKIYPSDFKPTYFGRQSNIKSYKHYDTNLINLANNNRRIEELAEEDYNGDITIYLYFSGRWGKKLKEVSDAFLNYISCRVRNDAVIFNFTFNELRIDNVANTEDVDEKKIDEIIEKINKLLNLADQSRNPSEHEAISASLKVQKLLSKYNLTMADIRGDKETEEPIEEAISDVGCGDNKQNWRTSLASAVANGYACKCYMKGSQNVVVFYGYKADTLTARKVYTYLYKVGVKLGRQYVKENKSYMSDYKVYQSFVTGFSSGVYQELQKNCTALALVCPKKVENEYNKLSESFGTSRIGQNKSNSLDYEAYSEGIIEGKRALNAQYIES